MEKCYFLNTLPAEVRLNIYGWVYSPSTLIRIRNPTARTRHLTIEDGAPLRAELPAFDFDYRMSKTRRRSDEPKPWVPSLSAVVLVNRQIYREAIEYLYSRTVFLFENLPLSYAFLASMPALRLRQITMVRLISTVQVHYHTSPGNGSNRGLRNIARAIAGHLPNLESIDIELTAMQDMTERGSEAHQARAFDRDRIADSYWFQALMQFAHLSKLRRVIVTIPEMPHCNVRGLWPWRRSSNDIDARHAAWRRALQLSLGDVIARLISREEEEDVWRDYSALVEAYLRYLEDPHVHPPDDTVFEKEAMLWLGRRGW